jgi:hypothetical protein
MNSNEAMKFFAEATSIKNRFLIALAGVLCLFFPGLILAIASKSLVAAFRKLSLQERNLVMSIINYSDSDD